MNIQQLQYIVSIDEHRHFQRAAEACFVTPATLSMMVKKLEQELDIIIFDRNRQPIVSTTIGDVIIQKAKNVLYHIKDLENTVKSNNEELSGEIRIAIIPTLAPYLSHLFLPSMMKKYPHLKIKLFEWNTHQIVDALNHDRVDIGIAATPLHRPEIHEHPLFQEQLVVYNADQKAVKEKIFIAPKDINYKRLWLLEEDHCLRSQVINLCSLKKKLGSNQQLEFEAGSLATLINIVNMNKGITILPELAIPALDEAKKECISRFTSPVPVREISLLTYRLFTRDKVLKVLAKEILHAVQPLLSTIDEESTVVDI